MAHNKPWPTLDKVRRHGYRRIVESACSKFPEGYTISVHWPNSLSISVSGRPYTRGCSSFCPEATVAERVIAAGRASAESTFAAAPRPWDCTVEATRGGNGGDRNEDAR
ncbi:unnamed protein product [Ixodes pacificus]